MTESSNLLVFIGVLLIGIAAALDVAPIWFFLAAFALIASTIVTALLEHAERKART